ncbi:MAG: hypothetical protein KatS3mg027_2273 [Bacteroidia bacterium]|nr:MAG: hypothetical protein KatS3mg027_2273 [Bacteroidia bacterium]
MNKVVYINIFFCILVILSSCKKNKNKYLIDNTLPESDIPYASYVDTFSVLLKTERIDSIRIYNDGFKYLGSNQDPVFGRTDVELFTHFSLPNNITNVAFPSDVVVDSAKIILVFTENFVGDTTTPLHYQTYLLTESMDATQTYYSNKTFQYNPIPLSDIVTKPVKFNGFKVIQIPVYKGFAQSIISNSQYLVDNTTFQATYKGFYITTKNSALNPSNKQGALMKVDLSNNVSGFYVYYHTGNPPALKESKVYQFSFNNSATVRTNHIIYDYASGSNVYLYNQLNGNANSAAQNVFVKGLNGTRVFVDFPFLKNLNTLLNYSINRAEFEIKVDDSYSSSIGLYNPPVAMSLLALDSAGNEIFTIDQYNSSYSFVSYDGQYNSTTKSYRFNISRYLQHVLTGKIKHYGMVLVATDPNVTLTARKDFFASRVILGGYNHSTLKPKLKLSITSIP